ncbi:unnamed protein product [Microthlaspi erraticum]|uniref:Myb-like domain-containing protein n=1 Tax=Microthlaspi erraticum TaxID=1685480 RepID=A0A6D2K9Z2_9BRAS|nr:unnamed protein product [Microthlaspi erraticum]
MVKWSKKDEERLLDSFNGGANWHHVSRIGLSGRFDAQACREKFITLQLKAWNAEDDSRLWKSRHLIVLRPKEVSANLRRPINSIKERLIELENERKEKPFCTGIDVLNDCKEKATSSRSAKTKTDDDKP